MIGMRSVIRRSAVLVAALTLPVFGVVACEAGDVSPSSVPSPSVRCEEDQPCWDAATMGNGRYDPRVWPCRAEGDGRCLRVPEMCGGLDGVSPSAPADLRRACREVASYIDTSADVVALCSQVDGPEADRFPAELADACRTVGKYAS